MRKWRRIKSRFICTSACVQFASVGYRWLETKSTGASIAFARLRKLSRCCVCMVAGPPTLRSGDTDLIAHADAL